MRPFDRLHMTSYYSPIVTMSPSCAVLEILPPFCQNLNWLREPGYRHVWHNRITTTIYLRKSWLLRRYGSSDPSQSGEKPQRQRFWCILCAKEWLNNSSVIFTICPHFVETVTSEIYYLKLESRVVCHVLLSHWHGVCHVDGLHAC